MRFSQRMGITSIRSIIQVDSMDDALRNGLWNCVIERYLYPISIQTKFTRGELFFENLWSEYFKLTLDDIPLSVKDAHWDLKNAFSSMYGWTSNTEGIRHGLQDEPDLGFEDAKYMLVACSGFINYLLEKAKKAGLDLPNP